MPDTDLKVLSFADVRSLHTGLGSAGRSIDRAYLAMLSPEERAKALAKRAYQRRIHAPRSPLSAKRRAGSRANKHRRTVPTFASDRRA